MIKYEGGVIRIKEILQELSMLSYNRLVRISTPQKKEKYMGASSYKQITLWGRAIYYDLKQLKNRNKKLAELYIKELTIRLSCSGGVEVCINAQKEPCMITVNVDDRSATELRKQANHLDLVNEYFKKSNFLEE